MAPAKALDAQTLLNELTKLLVRLDNPRLEARLLVQHALGVSREQLLARPEQAVSPEAASAARALAVRRAAGEPMAYLTGIREFFGLELAVGPGALIPRPETELLVEAVLDRVDTGADLTFADLGAGSGAIGIALAASLRKSTGILVDFSQDALGWAGRNVERHGLSGRLQLVRADFTCPLVRPGRLQVVVSNPPYVAAQEYQGLQVEVRDHEPRPALVPRGAARADGTGLYAGLARWAARALRPGGLVAVEMGAGQGGAVAESFERAGFSGVTVLRDLAGLDRVGLAVR